MMNKILVVDFRTSVNSINKLIQMGYDIIKLPADNKFDAPISAHPDIFMTMIKGHLFVDAALNNLFINKQNTIYCNREVECQKKIVYPSDVLFNCVNVGRYLICNKAFTHSSIIEFADANDIKIVDVKQGYAKCSTCVVSENAIITEDESIAKKSSEVGIDVLKIEKGHIKLDGYDYGFVGGCSGLIENDVLAFNGDIKKHPEYRRILHFCDKYSVNVVSLCEEPLYDIGSIIRL